MSKILKRAGKLKPRRAGLWLYLALLSIVFVFGGSSRDDFSGLVLLRPICIVAFFYYLSRLQLQTIKTHVFVLAFSSALFALVVMHMIPLPPSVWSGLGGRAIIGDVLGFAQSSDAMMPLSMTPSRTLNAFYALFVPMAVLLGYLNLDEQGQRIALRAITILLILGAIVTIIQASGLDLYLYQIRSDTPAGLFANRNHHAVAIVSLSLILSGYIMPKYLRSKLQPNHYLLLVFAVNALLFPIVLISGSRAGTALFLLAFLFVALFMIPRASGRRQTSLSRWSSLASAVVLMGSFVLLSLSLTKGRTTAWSRFISLDDDLRYGVWDTVWEIIPQYLPWGSGVGSAVEVYQLHEPDSELIPTYSNHVHNDWMEVLLTAGVPGAILLGVAVLAYLWMIWRLVESRQNDVGLRWVGAAIISVLGIASVVDYPLRTPALASLFVLAAVWATGRKRQEKFNEGKAIE